MECLKCHFQNPETSKFCLECGKEFKTVCLFCGHLLPPGAKFCNECGEHHSPTGEPISKKEFSQEKLEKIQRYLPKGLTQKILAGKDKIEGERKQVTVMFCDMEGFVPLVEHLGAEKAYGMMDQVYEILIHKVHTYEGTVNEMTGDGIMALFGAPMALEDAPQKAIRSAHAIHLEMARFSAGISQGKRVPLKLKMRIGIHTGSVIVGTLGNDLRVEFKAVGSTVNLASRMEGLAVPGSTYVSDDTFKLTEQLFRFEALGEHTIKGKAEKVKAYRVIAPSTLRTHFDVSAERGLTPFQGRERELELLLDGFERAKAGRGQAFSIMAEAGIGKSRLLYEFRKAVTDQDVHFMEGKCLSYRRHVPHYPIIDILKPNFDIKESDSADRIIEKVKAALTFLDIPGEDALFLLLDFFSIKHSAPKLTLWPGTVKNRIIKVLEQIVLKFSRVKTLVIAIEDLHWVDKGSEEIFKFWLESLADARVCLIFTFRPDYRLTWGSKSHHNQLTLNRLSNRESLAMVAALLSSFEIHRDLENLILEKTEGIPFFIEELIRSLRDLNLIRTENGQSLLAGNTREIAIPSTIQDVIMSRVDGMPDEAKELLQLAAMIEREFDHILLKKASGLEDAELLSRLAFLKDRDLIYERGVYPDATYVFTHALTREVVLASILSVKREALCIVVGRAMEKVHKDTLWEYTEILAEYFFRGRDYKTAETYYKLSGRKAQKTASFTTAISHVKRRIHCLEQLPIDGEKEKQIIEARIYIGLYCMQMVFPVEAKSAVDPILEIVEKKGYKRSIALIDTILATYYHLSEENYSRAKAYYHKAERLGHELNDTLALALVHNNLGCFWADQGKFDESLAHLDQAQALNKASKISWAIAQTYAFQSVWIYNQRGQVDHALTAAEQALAIANESGDIFAGAQANTAMGMSLYRSGLLAEAKPCLHKGVSLSHKSNLLSFAGAASYFLGWAYFHEQEYDKARYALEEALSFFRKCHMGPSYINACHILGARIESQGQRKQIPLHRLFKWYGQIKNKWIVGEISNSVAAVMMDNQGSSSEAEKMIKTAMILNESYGMTWALAWDHLLYSRWFHGRNKPEQARKELMTALDLMASCKADAWVEKLKSTHHKKEDYSSKTTKNQ